VFNKYIILEKRNYQQFNKPIGMIMEKRIYNFSAGPAILPEEVLLEAQKDLYSYKGSGMSV